MTGAHKLLQSLIPSGSSVTLYTTGGHTFTGYPTALTQDSVRLGSNGPKSGPFSAVDLAAIIAVRYV